MNDPTDLLQIKIEQAKAQLSENTLNAIATVPWQAEILKMRETKGYSFEQLGDLEIETELLLCGLLSPENYPKELESRMKISKAQVNELVNEMNKQVFAKIKENLMKNTEQKDIFIKKQIPPEGSNNTEKEEKSNTQVLESAGIEIIPEKLELTAPPQILTQKLSGYVKNEVKETDHSLNNLTSSNAPSAVPIKPAIDPYREVPE